MRRIKVWGGVHADETGALRYIDSLVANPISNVAADNADPVHGLLKRRSRLCCAFPGSLKSRAYLAHRAAEIVSQSLGYYGVVDIHLAPGNVSYAVVDRENGISPVMMGMLRKLGMSCVVAGPPHSITGSVHNAVQLEVARGESGITVADLRKAINNLANSSDPPTASTSDFQWFRKAGGIHVGQAPPGCIRETGNAVRPFSALPESLAARLGFEGRPVSLVGWLPDPNENGYWAEAATPIPTPDDSLWPG